MQMQHAVPFLLCVDSSRNAPECISAECRRPHLIVMNNEHMSCHKISLWELYLDTVLAWSGWVSRMVAPCAVSRWWCPARVVAQQGFAAAATLKW